MSGPTCGGRTDDLGGSADVLRFDPGRPNADAPMMVGRAEPRDRPSWERLRVLEGEVAMLRRELDELVQRVSILAGLSS